MEAGSSACMGVPMTGRCLDSQTVAACVVGTNGEGRLVTNPCGTGYACVTETDKAYCKLTAVCREGQSRCQSATTQQVCKGGTWQDSSCAAATQCRAFPGIGGSCVPTGLGITVQGSLRYERRQPNATLSGYTAPSATAAAGVFVEVVDGTEILGTGFTDSQGQFAIAAYRPPSISGQVVYIPIDFHPDDSPAYGVALAKDGDTINTSPGMWSFATSNLPAPVKGFLNVGTQTVKADNSGAIQIFEWLRSHFARMTTQFGSAPAQSLAVLWKPGIDAFCLACFINRAGGGTNVGSGLLPLHFDTTILLSGSTMSPLHWSGSVVNHELGHFVLDEYSRPPGEGGIHYINAAESPGLAWSEGYATWDGQAALSAGQPAPNPIYFSVQQGTAFYVDISDAMSSAGMIPLPDPSGSIDQQVAEVVVASIAWDLWRSGNDTAVQTSITLPRMTGGLNRGYKTVDLVDFADALLCGQRLSATELSASMNKYRFPWDNQPICP